MARPTKSRSTITVFSVITLEKVKTWLFDSATSPPFEVAENEMLTTAAKEFLEKHDIAIVEMEKVILPAQSSAILEQNEIETFIDATTQEFKEKNSHWTHLRGNQLIPKTDPLIAWRGKMDTLLAHILLTQLVAQEESNSIIFAQLNEINHFIRRLFYAETMDEVMEVEELLHFTPSEIKEISHRPLYFLGVDHFFVHVEMGKLMIYLNMLRTQIRELELQSLVAFAGKRDDICLNLNLLSSAIYTIMLFLRRRQIKYS